MILFQEIVGAILETGHEGPNDRGCCSFAELSLSSQAVKFYEESNVGEALLTSCRPNIVTLITVNRLNCAH